MKTMAEVIQAHWSASTHTDRKPAVDKCDGCGVVIRTWGDDSDMPAQLAAHQAAALTAAGFGPVWEAQAQAWDEGADFMSAGCWTETGSPGNPYRAAAVEGGA